MKFVRTPDWEEAAAALAQRLVLELAAGRRVLWLTSGGSNIAASLKVMQQIPAELSQKLSIMPADERYGPPGHPESNLARLLEAGFHAKQAKLLPALKAGLDFDQNAAYYSGLAKQAFADNDLVIGQLGIGPDGHIAGILPDSPACNESQAWVAHYDAPPLQRMTLTFAALRQLNAAYVLAYGDNKLGPLSALKDEDLPLSQQPAQILKQLSTAYVYNDQLEEADD